MLLPASGAEPVRILLVPPDAEGAVATVAVAVDAAASRVLSVQDPRTMPAAELALRWAHDLHFGQGFGPVWRGLTIVTGLVLPIFAVTAWPCGSTGGSAALALQWAIRTPNGFQTGT